MNALARFDGNPAEIGYPPTLPIEIALKTASIQKICEAYGLSREDWDALRTDPVFVEDLKQAVEMIRKEGMSFRIKAKLQSEELLKTSWTMIQDQSGRIPASVRADLIKATIRWAGLEPDAKAQAQLGNALQININLG